MGEKQPLTKKLPPTTTVSTCWLVPLSYPIAPAAVCFSVVRFSGILQ
uniref:Uncharacterized protein n=1 Tax=Arundo donax TaxID=35708 RepID=A0A0A9DX84_ARUDO